MKNSNSILFKFGSNNKYLDGIINKSIEIDESILDSWRKNVGLFPAETGGMLGAKNDKSTIDLYVFDEKSKNTGASYYYDKDEMSKVYNNWKSKGFETVGFVHSHPNGIVRPSFQDISTALIHMDFFKHDYFIMPILQPDKNGLFTVYFYVAELKRDVVITTLHYVIKATETGYDYIPFRSWKETLSVNELCSQNEPYKNVTKKYNSQKLFSKINNLFPRKVRQKVIVCIGVGGAREFLANMARNGFENYILIDHDVVSETNIATQAVYVNEIGRSKVEAVTEELLNINPGAKILSVDRYLDNDMSDEDFKAYLDEFKYKKSTDYIILGCTDNFHAQERAAALALKYEIPYLAAMMYKNGAGAELIFTYPGVTPSCPRCLLRHRYEQYEKGFENDVDSSSCSYFATSIMNAYKGYIAMMILAYHCAPNSAFNNMLDQVKNRNFVWIRLDPNISEILGITLFDKAFASAEKYTYFGEPIWVPQTPDNIKNGTDNCKLCGGIGNLKKLKNRWKDTRDICGISKDKTNVEKVEKVKDKSLLFIESNNLFDMYI